MKIGEARERYVSQHNTLFMQKRKLEQKLKEEGSRMSREERGVILELSDQISKEYKKTGDFLNNLALQSSAIYNAEVTKQQTEAIEDASEDMAKCMETARRIAKGDKVPAYDEQKLMEFSFEMYMSAKNAAMINAGKSDKEHKSLWQEEEETVSEAQNIDEKVDNAEVSFDAPEQVSFELPE